eukprot:TRINITY_DN1041_c0_g1_i3.p1 TRINITY_DN1041_c0_g1~~TRINITY_DN1041_c0_g1_i3.p1  ORF type:complete len:336 (+),score=44.43 TRINITY_DN1041_c0_g1_i3:63-1070(+)
MNTETQPSQGEEKEVNPVSIFHDTLRCVAWITIFSIFGTLTRLGINALNNYDGAVLPSLTWTQFVGSSVLGFLLKESKLFPNPKTRKTEPLYVGLSVGYCGSVTTFSKWLFSVYLYLSNSFPAYDHNHGYNVISTITEIMVTLATSFCGFYLGGHIGLIFSEIFQNFNLEIPKFRGNLAFTIFMLVLASSFQAGAIALSVVKEDWRGQVTFALVFSPAGALTRWVLSLRLNTVYPGVFPLGTFVANISASLLSGIFFLCRFYVDSRVGCQLLEGITDGFCGCLSTVSTFIAELDGLTKWWGYLYGGITIGVGLVVYVLLDGINFWLEKGELCPFE